MNASRNTLTLLIGLWMVSGCQPEDLRFDDNPIVATCGSSGRSMPIFGRRERVVADAAFDSLDLVSATPTTNPIDDDFIRLGVVAVGRTRIVVHRDSDPRTNLFC